MNMAQMHRVMQPIAPLMTEHRLIERMVSLLKIELDRIGTYGRIDPDFIDNAVSFMKEFSDISHHGKEEKILFAELSKKPLSRELKKTMDDLIQEHIFMRKLVNDLVRAKDNYMRSRPDAKAEVIVCLNSLAEFYPPHIEKEDKHFFMPVMDYLSDGEKEGMLQTFQEFDSRLFHDEYRMMVSGLEEQWHVPSGPAME
jgi:hemerythrin-like domain-containing protein